MTALSTQEIAQLREVLDDKYATPACAAIRSIPEAQFTEGVAAQIICTVMAKIEGGNWKHTELAKFTAACLADTASELEVAL